MSAGIIIIAGLACVTSTAGGYFAWMYGKLCSFGYGPTSGSYSCSTSNSQSVSRPSSSVSMPSSSVSQYPSNSGGSGSNSGSISGSS